VAARALANRPRGERGVEGRNLTLTFVDRLLDLDAEGKPALASYQVVTLGIPAWHFREHPAEHGADGVWNLTEK
jgi:hypothetical protein